MLYKYGKRRCDILGVSISFIFYFSFFIFGGGVLVTQSISLFVLTLAKEKITISRKILKVKIRALADWNLKQLLYHLIFNIRSWNNNYR